MVRFQNRSDAGKRLAEALTDYRDQQQLIVLALPRGGVPVAVEVAAALRAPLDLLLVRKLGVPNHEELAMGAISSNHSLVLNREIIAQLRISEATVASTRAHEERELLRRDRVYRDDRAPPEIRERTVILIDDGIATGATMRVAISVLRAQAAAKIVVATPVVPSDVARPLQQEVDEFVYLIKPEPFYGVGFWYEDYMQVSDEDVIAALNKSWGSPAQALLQLRK
ncbi:MAG TPA: phosphoribosyltransferase family protein [Spongiibacteraceae bacterium]